MTRTSIERLADDAPVPHADSWPARRPPSMAYAAVHAALKAQAGRTVRAVIKDRARAYALRPRDLDAIREGLFGLPPQHLVTALAYLARIDQQRLFVCGGEVVAINRRAAMLYARHSRAIANRNERRMA